MSPSSRTPPNLVAGDTNGRTDVFVQDRSTGKTTRESKGPSGQGNQDSTVASVSQDGRFVVLEFVGQQSGAKR